MATLMTNLNHIETKDQLSDVVKSNENVMVICGRMGPMCVPVYASAEELSKDYKNVEFCDMLFDLPDADAIRSLPECQGFMGLPFVVYYKNGKVVKATSSLQATEQIVEILDTKFGK